ncbi:histidine phosphatase family protein [Pelagibacterales bacterium SAG-MED05]|nr:histidine phosphatase family protein [Pelagibacterales bacterium SAG-MED05]
MTRIIVPLSFFIIFLFLFSNVHAAQANWKPAKNGDKIILIRHSKAPGFGDPPGFQIKDCKTQRNLSKEGVDQSKKIGRLFKKNKIKIDQVLSSQWCRCKDTAKYAFKNYKEFSALNSTFQSPYDKNAKKQIKELKEYIQKWNGNGSNLVLVTHYVIITAITDVIPRSGEIVIIDKNFNTLSTILTN